MKLFKMILAGLAGLVVAGATVAAVEALAHGAVTGDALFAVVILGYGLAACLGAATAAALSGRAPAIVVAVLLAALALVNLFAFPHPIWFAPAAAVVLAAGTILGLTLAQRFKRGVAE